MHKTSWGQRRVETTKCTNHPKGEAGTDGHKREPGIRTEVNKENEEGEIGMEKTITMEKTLHHPPRPTGKFVDSG
jgi:hypothetical protein